MSLFGFSFWRSVAKHPDLAMALLRGESDCIVDGTRRSGYDGPFMIATQDGRTHRVHIRHAAMKELQDRLKRILDGHDPVPSHLTARWSLYIVREEKEIWYAVHGNSALRVIECIAPFFDNNRFPLPPWSLQLNFNRNHTVFELTLAHFADEDGRAELHARLRDIDPKVFEQRGEPVFVDSARRELRMDQLCELLDAHVFSVKIVVDPRPNFFTKLGRLVAVAASGEIDTKQAVSIATNLWLCAGIGMSESELASSIDGEVRDPKHRNEIVRIVLRNRNARIEPQ